MSYNAIDFFSGAGGLHIGFKEAGFDIKLCIDNDSLVERTHKRNFPNIPMINRDIRTIPSSEIKSFLDDGTVDVIIGAHRAKDFLLSEKEFPQIQKREQNMIHVMNWF